ncbi:uncharacterized protein LOC105024300 [Esox lucius]|uniref:C2H2-type domain-containing protein n=1 Tax=Esox lucius TaxID=8010 RepID=A0A3P8YZH1_ESOLU|nr:uncharacterized protein LOC105024300 [Esox lucius]
MDQPSVDELGTKCVMQNPTQSVETGGQAVATEEQPIGSGVQTVETEEHSAVTGDHHLETSQQPISELLPVSGVEALESGLDSNATTEIILELSAVPIDFGAPEEGKQDPYENAQEKTHVDCVATVERKNIPPKKDRLEPLKIDMSRSSTGLMPLTSSQISLQCMECYIIFSDHKSRMRHLKQRHPVQYEQCMLGDALFACYVCDRHFTNSSELMLHQRAHTEKQPFKCPICGDAFRRSSELTLHKKVHFGRHGYACSDCGKLCKTLTLLKYHRRTHTGERPYVCKECGKRYSMPKALQRHLLTHSPGGVETEGDGITPLTKAQLQKNDCTTAVKYLCSICKAPFKTVKTRLYHMKRKHSSCVAAPTNITRTTTPLTGQQMKPGQSIVTQAPMGQPNYFHMEPHGPLQQVDNIDTEQIRKLIESLGNVQKVNQVVILGQVPPHGQPLDLQQLQGIGEPVQLCFTQPQFTELKQTGVGESESLELEQVKPQCDSGEETITLEPVLSNDQMDTRLDSQTQEDTNTVPTEHNGLTKELNQMHVDMIQPELLGQAGPTVDLENTMIQTEQMIGQCETVELGQTPEQSQTVVFELTPSLIPTLELEQTQTDQQGLISASSLPTIEFEPTAEHDQMVKGENVCVPSLIPTAELELPPLQTDQQELFTVDTTKEVDCPQTPGQLETSQLGESSSEFETLQLNHRHSFGEEGHTQQTEVPETVEKPLLEDENEKQCVLQTSCEGRELSASEERKTLKDQCASDNLSNNREVQPHTQTSQTVLPPSETKKLPQTSQLPVHLMSVQEFVKVRKRKQSDNSIMQGNMQQQRADLKAKPTKQPRAKNARLVVKFSPKEKQKKPSQMSKLPRKEELIQDVDQTPVKTQLDKVPLKQKACKGKKVKKPNSISKSKIKSPPVFCDSQVQQVVQAEEQVQQVKQGKKVKRQKDVTSENHAEQIIEQELIARPKPKKKKKQQQQQQQTITQEDQPKKLKAKKLSKSGRKRMKQSMKTSPVLEHPQIEQQSLLLLKGHKQPQLKVYKLDTSKAPQGQIEETSPSESQTDLQQDQDTAPIQKNKGPKCKLKLIVAGGKRKVGRPKKNQTALSILAPLKDTSCSSDTSPSKPKTNRKRKAPEVETEGIITGSHPHRALECKDCGERFSDVSSLQEHKVALHAVESPGLTYTNGNIFEGVLRSDLGQPPLKVTKEGTENSSGQKSFGMEVASDWDIEVDMKEVGLKERGERISFPALNSSPSLPLVVSLEADQLEDMEKNINKTTEGMESCSLMAPNSTPSNSRSQDKFSHLSKSVQTFLSEKSSSHLTPIVPLHSPSKAGNTKTENEGNINETSGAPVPTASSDHLAPTEEDIKEELLLEVDLVTVGDGEQNVEELHEGSSQNDRSSLPEHKDLGLPAHAQIENVNITERILNDQSESCPSDQPDIKQEEEEILVQMRDVQKRGVCRKTAFRGRRKVIGHGKKVFATRKSLGEGTKEMEPEKETEECQVVYQLYSHTNNIEIKDEAEFTTLHPAPSSLSLESEIRSSPGQRVIAVPCPSESCVPSPEESSEDQVVFELESVTTSVVEVLKEEDGTVNESAPTDQDDRDTGQSPGIILERFFTSRQREATAREHGVADPGDRDVKLENTSDLVSVPPTSHATHRVEQCGVRMYLFEQESSLVSNSPEISQDNTQTELNADQSNAKQCIFYPVKEEEPSQSERDMPAVVVPGEAKLNHPVDNLHMTHPALEECEVKRQKAVQSGIEINEYGEGDLDIEQQETEELLEFLLQSSDEESEVIECSDAQPDSEALVMACYHDSQNPTSSHYLPNNFQTTERQAPSGNTGESQTRTGYMKPIDYFSKYFGWDTWVEIAQCTNKVSQLSNPLTANEVAQYVGIHIAMGTLKFPSLKLYWQDLTRVPLVADTMTASRFSQLSCKLKLASPAPAGESMDSNELGHIGNTDITKEGVNICNPVTALHIPTNPAYGTIRTELDGSGHTLPSSCSPVEAVSPMSVKSATVKPTILHSNRHRSGNVSPSQNLNSLKMDPLWRVRPLLNRVQAGCLMLRREGDHGIDQYRLPLTCSPVNNTQPSLHSTVLVGSDGLVLDFNLSVDLSNKEATVEKMVPRNGMVYLCKQELSTPTMLERLLEAGVHGAGKVGGARGQIGDEFVSSDGRLMLRRFDLGFILSTVGKTQQNMASLIDSFDKAQKAASLNSDLRNLYRTPLSASAPTSWPQAVLWYLTDLALVNSWVQYRQEHGPLPELLNLMGFRLEVSKALILSSGSDTQDSAPPHPPAQKMPNPGTAPEPGLLQESPLPDTATRYDGSGHWPEQLGDGEGGRCRFGGCERMSRVRCLKCCVFLCISRNHNCFLGFHNQGSF